MYVVEWGSPMSYALLNTRPSLIFAVADPFYSSTRRATHVPVQLAPPRIYAVFSEIL